MYNLSSCGARLTIAAFLCTPMRHRMPPKEMSSNECSNPDAIAIVVTSWISATADPAPTEEAAQASAAPATLGRLFLQFGLTQSLSIRI